MYDAFPEKKEDELKKSSRQSTAVANGATDTTKSTGSAARKGAVADDGKTSNSHATGGGGASGSNGTKDSHANGSTNATGAGTTTSGNSKKRKALTQSLTSNAHKESHAPSAGASTTTGSKRGASNQAVTISGKGYRESNLLSFEKSKAVLVDGKLIADDGTVLERNGKKQSQRLRGGETLICYLLVYRVSFPFHHSHS